jgi:ribosome-associated heat shock protein Hsp15
MTETSLNDKKIRLDKWLKVSRIFKTRSQAAHACEDGKVKVNGQKSKPARIIGVGDQITVKFRSKYRTFDVLGVVQKNVSTKDAKLLYREHAPQLSENSQTLYELLQEMDKEGRRKYKGRPTKKERRQIEKIRGY